MKTFVQEGGTVRYKNNGAGVIPSGAVVVIGGLLAVAMTDIPPGEEGACAAEGVHLLPKAAGVGIATGDRVVWDVSALSGAGGFGPSSTTTATGDVTGGAIAWAAAASADAAVLVKIGYPGTLVP